MTPPAFDADTVGRRLRLLREALDDLDELRGVDAPRLRSERLTRAAAERLVQVVADLALDVNAHIAVAVLGRAPETGRSSFALAAEAGALDPALAERLAPAAGLRNVLVHRYTDIDVAIVAQAVGEVLDGFPDYVRQVAAFLERRDAEGRAGSP